MNMFQAAINRDIRPILQEMIEQETGAPLWVEMIPAGTAIEGRDGRKWTNSNPQAVVDSFDANGADLPIDVEHSTELKAPAGEIAPAMGWIKTLEVREDNSIWALVEWTEEGRWLVESRQYRYISPVMIYNTKSGEIVRLTSAGLTNNPNLHLTALNQREPEPNGEPETMNELLKMLGLTADASEESAMNAVKQLMDDRDSAVQQADEAKAANSNLERFVPRADHDKAVNRAEQAEEALATIKTEQRDQEIDTAINQALESGKITPATADYHRAACKEEGGLDRFREFTKAAPVVGENSGMEGQPGEVDTKALNAEEQKMAAMFGNSAEDFAKYAD